MAIANYPATPNPNIVVDVPIDFKFERYLFEDGAAAVNVQPCGVARWVLIYEGLLQAERQTLLDHFNAAKDKVEDFTFTHPRLGTIYTGVKYESLKLGKHVKNWALPVEVTLWKLL